MHMFENEVIKFEKYKKIDNSLEVSSFIYKLMGICVLSSVIFKFLVTPLFKQASGDIFILIFLIMVLPWAFCEAKKNQDIYVKQKEIMFESVNVYKFISHYLSVNTNGSHNMQNIDILFHVITGEMLKKALDKDGDEDLRKKEKSIRDKTIEMPSVEILKYLNK